MTAFRIIYFRDLDRLPRSGVSFSHTDFLRTTVPNTHNVLCIALNSSPSCDTLNTAPIRTDGRKKFVEGRKFMGGKIGHAEEEEGGKGKCQADAEDFAQKMHKR